jgi:hypothetical protein
MLVHLLGSGLHARRYRRRAAPQHRHFTPPPSCTQEPEFGNVSDALFRQVARCLTSPHFQVAERSLFLWNNEYVVGLVAAQRAAVLPLVIGALEHNAAHHWNPAVHK